MQLMPGSVELFCLERLGNYCLLNLKTGEKEFYDESKKKVSYFTGLYFKDENTFFAIYPTENGPIMYYEGQEYELNKGLHITLNKNGKKREFIIEEYNVRIRYSESPYIGFDVWSDEEDVDLFYQITKYYQCDEYYKKFTKSSYEIITELYLVKFQFKNSEHYALWNTDDVDGFLLDGNGKIRTFVSEDAAGLFAKREGYHLDNEITLISSAILLPSNMEKIDCNLILTYWNIFSDVARSANYKFLGDNNSGDIEGIYQKLFYGCNLPAIRKDGEIFSPEWSESEKKRLTEVLDNGFQIISDAIK